MKSGKNKVMSVMLFAALIIGVSIMAYPAFSNWWNENRSSKVISDHQQALAHIDESQYDELFAQAREYNEKLKTLHNPFVRYDEIEGYEQALDVSGTGVIGYITIPSIQVELPIYHGTSEDVLNVAVGHLQGSSLPIGGESTHAVLSGHRGLPSAKLFTDLDKIVKGDYFTLNVLNEKYTYEVEDILIVKPDEMDKIGIISGKDYVTLMTCTPYGVNTHRLLIRSHRIDNFEAEKKLKIASEAVQVDPLIVIPVIAAPLFLLLCLIWKFTGKKKEHDLSEFKIYGDYDI